MLFTNLREYLKLRRYAISNYQFSGLEEYGSYFLMIIGWLSFVLLNITSVIEFIVAIPLCFFLGVTLREVWLVNILPAIFLAWLLDTTNNEKESIIDKAITSMNRNNTTEE